GLRCMWQVEIDEWRRSILAKHWPDVPRHDDIRTFNPPSTPDIIVGGYPCKQTSNAAAIHNKRSGLAGQQSGLWFEMLRVVRECQPDWVVVENTAGAATWQDTIKAGLESAGYCVPDKPVALSASGFGAPHRRRRLFWIADRDGKGLAIARQAGPPEAVSVAGRAIAGDAWRASDARTVRVADRAPGRLDRRRRIESVGDAVCPPVAEWIARRIVAAEAAKH
ncbi:MAG: DNA cytosine methyltransferase, partial [Planctomycetota bacterium]